MLKFIFVILRPSETRTNFGIGERLYNGFCCFGAGMGVYPSFADGYPAISAVFAVVAAWCGYAALSR